MASKRERAIYKKSNIFGVMTVVFVCAVICIVTFVGSQDACAKNESYAAQEQELESMIKEESQRAEELEDYSRYVDSDEFKEKAAREKFGLVKEDEVVIKEGK